MALHKELKMKSAIATPGHEALLSVMRTASMIQKRAHAFFSTYGITDAQYNILIVLKVEDMGLSQVEIGERVVASRANITSMVDRLEKKGYVKRSTVEGDRRVFRVNLTKEGQKILSAVESKYLDEVKNLMSSLDKGECRKISMLLEKIRKNV